MKKLFLSLLVMAIPILSFSQISARMFRYPDVSRTQITFCYAGDIWVVNKEGGTAYKLSSPAGEETYPKFSPDGKTIAFTGNYYGNSDVYTIPVKGGVPQRLTYHGGGDRVVGWHPNGKQVLFASARESGKDRWNQLYLTGLDNGLPEKLPMAYAENASYNKDASMMAFTDKTRLNRNWKRYRGGMAPDIWLINLNTKKAHKIAASDANDELPMIKGDLIYFLSDRGANERDNIWVYNTKTKATTQITKYADYDVHYPSMGPDDIVYEAGEELYLLNLKTKHSKKLTIKLLGDQRRLIEKTSESSRIMSYSVSRDAKRIATEARGEIFTVPVQHGYTANLTQSSGVAERYPAWSPDGKYLAYWSDKSGEYQLVLRNMKDGSIKTLTHFKNGYRYHPMWSPDSKKMVFIQQDLVIKLIDINSSKVTAIDSLNNGSHSSLENFSVNWDSTSKWITYGADKKSANGVVAVYNVKNNKKTELTSGFYNDHSPVFSSDDKYIYFLTDRNFIPQYSEFQGTWVYHNSSMLAALPLTKEVGSPIPFRNDEATILDKKNKKNKKKSKKTNIDFDNAEQRVVVLPVRGGDYSKLSASNGKIVYLDNGYLKYYDVRSRQEQKIMSGISSYQIAANGRNMLVVSGGSAGIINIAPNQRITNRIKFNEMNMLINPKEEWHQIFRDAWRLERDFFYDKNMHGVDWKGVYDKYLPFIDQSATRWDVSYVIGEMLGELSSSHAYYSGGDVEYPVGRVRVGYLGVNYSFENGAYKIKHIVKGSKWDVKTKSPLSEPGVDVKEGDYLLAVNGVPLDTNKSPYAAFQGLANKSVELTVNDTPKLKGAHKVVVRTMSDEYRLRNLEWIEMKRARVDAASNGKIGYIYVPDTGVGGQTELVRQFMGQWQKPALIIDDRWNSGGQIPDRFIELLNRKPLSFIAGRTGIDKQIPYVAHYGPKVMLTNGWSGSGGDAFPDFFKKAKVGKVIGTRTWGGLIGISGAPQLIDGGSITVPTFRLYDPDGTWFKEGHGVDPDIHIGADASKLSKGIDNQLEGAIKETLKELKSAPNPRPKHAPYQTR